jgi:hypothetical protein
MFHLYNFVDFNKINTVEKGKKKRITSISGLTHYGGLRSPKVRKIAFLITVAQNV